MIALHLLDRTAAPSCLHLTAPLWRPALLGCSASGPVIGLCHSLFGRPVGLVLAGLNSERSAAALLSLAVVRPHRRQGIATGLMRRLEVELAALGCRRVHAEYSHEAPGAAIVQRLLANLGWEPPTASHISCKIAAADFRRLVRAPWVTNAHLTREFSIFRWGEATQGELDALRRQQGDSPIWEGVDPFKGAGAPVFDDVNSLGLRYDGEIVGWVLTQTLRPASLLLYDRLYVSPAFRTGGRAIALVAAAVKRHYERHGQLDTIGGCFRTDLDNAPMMQFVRRRLASFLTSAVEISVSSKPLPVGSA